MIRRLWRQQCISAVLAQVPATRGCVVYPVLIRTAGVFGSCCP